MLWSAATLDRQRQERQLPSPINILKRTKRRYATPNVLVRIKFDVKNS